LNHALLAQATWSDDPEIAKDSATRAITCLEDVLAGRPDDDLADLAELKLRDAIWQSASRNVLWNAARDFWAE
jgi:hypothetical protein